MAQPEGPVWDGPLSDTQQRAARGHAHRCGGQVPVSGCVVHPDQCLCHQLCISFVLPAPTYHLSGAGDMELL